MQRVRTTQHDITRRMAALSMDRSRLRTRIQAGRRQPLPDEAEQFRAIDDELKELEGLMARVSNSGSWRLNLLYCRS